MVENKPEVSPAPSSANLPARQRVLIASLVSIGLMLAIVGVVVGLRMALNATVIPCPDGTRFPQGTTDFRCFAHLHAGDGTAIALISAVLAILILLSGVVAAAVLTRQPETSGAI